MARANAMNPTKPLLILDDDQRLAKALACEFQDRGYSVTIAHSIATIPDSKFDFALIDLRLVGEMGLNALPKIKARSPDCKMVVLSGYGSVITAVEAMKQGALDYLRKPASVDTIEATFQGRKLEQMSNLMESSTLSEIESEYIDVVLTRNSGNVSRSAKELGLHRQSLQRKLKKYT